MCAAYVPVSHFLSGSLKLTFEVVSEEPPTHARMRVSGKGIGSAVVIDTALRLAGEDGGTQLHWEAELIEREGLLKPVGESLIKIAAQKVVNDAWSRFREAM